MNKQQKIIISIVGITIVLLALLGITYAYYLTRIEGNTNTNSISITTADLKLVYGDGNEIVSINNLMPGTTIGEKTFTVSNTGNSAIKNYKVALEYAVIDGVLPSLFVRPQDFEITLTCVSKSIETNEVSGECSGYTGKWNNESFEMTLNNIDEGIKHEYSLTIYYANPDIDQSDDMGKNLNLKVQIYGENDVSILNGVITGVSNNYTMKLHSDPKASVLNPTENVGEYSYKFIGVKPGVHTLYIIDAEGNEVSSETITINKGNNVDVSGTNITVKDTHTNIFLTSSNSNGSLTSSVTFNPYNSNTNSLAYHVINNSIYNKNGTIYRDVPITKPVLNSIPFVYQKDKTTVQNETTISVTTSYQSRYWTYATSYEVNENTGKINLIEPKLCKYSDSNCISDMVAGGNSVYLVGSSQSSNSSSSQTLKETTDLSSIYLITSAPYSTSTSITIGVKKLVAKQVSIENELSVTTDDYGISYYFRGGVEDNYVNFADMCWRIVRIAGDGAVKLILEDSTEECDSELFTGKWNDDNIYQFGNPTDFLNSSGKLVDAFKSFQTTKLSSLHLQNLKGGYWCYDDSFVEIDNFRNYGSYNRIIIDKNPSLKCIGSKIDKFADGTNMYVATLTADEISFAGANESNNSPHYLISDYAKEHNIYWWTLSPRRYNVSNNIYMLFFFDKNGILTYDSLELSGYYRPSVLLRPGIEISSGDGTINNPYIVD